jgi:hypothetical protein
MIKQTTPRIGPLPSQEEAVSALIGNLRRGVEALEDPQIEAKVREYFERHPNYSCDLIHVAAIACSFQAAKERVTTQVNSNQAAKSLSHRA